jgi:hypothetical protein
MAKKPTRGARQPTRSAQRPPVHFPGGSGSLSPEQTHGSPGSGSGLPSPHCKFFPKDQPLPVELTLHLDGPVEGGFESGRQQLHRPTVLIHAQDPAFACCWFSRAIDLGDEAGNPAFWMLQKTAMDTWLLCLRRVSGELAAYNLKTKGKGFPITLKKGRTTKDFNWPATITIHQRG